jgi:competence CoiA-like predicted nuclease
MPLTATDTRTGLRLVVCEQLAEAREAGRAGALVCPFCEGAVVAVEEHLRRGHWVKSYARHRAAECAAAGIYHPESQEHLASKFYLAQTCRRLYPDALVELEVRIPEINRVADVCVTFPDGRRIIHEAQLAAISTDDLEARTDGYQSLGYNITWHLGKSAATEPNKRWAFRRLGGCSVLDFTEQPQLDEHRAPLLPDDHRSAA